MIPVQFIGDLSMFSRVSRRCLHTSRSVWNEEMQDAFTKLGKGKKLPPSKQNLVILNAAQSRLVRKVPKYFQEQNAESQKHSAKKIVNTTELEEQRSKLTKINTKLTNEQALRQLNQIKPSQTRVSAKRYEQIIKEISSFFTLAQLRDYLAAEYPHVAGYRTITKARVIPKILHECWGLEISDDIKPEDDLVLQREFDLSQRELYLLLVKRTFDKWIRANVKIIILPEELRVIVRSNKSHLQYIELALEKILNNIAINEIELDSIEKYLKSQNGSLPIDAIQRLSGVFFQPIDVGQSNEYKMYSLGSKKFSQAKRLISWSLENNSFIKDLTLTNFDEVTNKSTAQYFQNFSLESLPWLYQEKKWFRLQIPKTKDFIPLPIDLDIEKIRDDLRNKDIKKAIPKPPGILTQSVTAVTFGQVLHELDDTSASNPKKSILNTQIPSIKNALKSLPLFEFEQNSTEDYMDSSLDVSQDYHSYFAQIKYIPSVFQMQDTESGKRNVSDVSNFLNHPPLEFWFEVDEKDQVKMDTLQAVLIENETNSAVLLPSHSTDLKFIKSSSVTLVDPNTSNPTSNDWLSDQPGIRRHLEHAKLDFSGTKTVRVPDFVDVNLPGSDSPVRYEYVSLSYRRHLNYRFNDKLLQFAVIEGGSLGGRTTELIMVGNEQELDDTDVDVKTDSEQLERESLQGFVQDVTQFVEHMEKQNNKSSILRHNDEDDDDLELT